MEQPSCSLSSATSKERLKRTYLLLLTLYSLYLLRTPLCNFCVLYLKSPSLRKLASQARGMVQVGIPPPVLFCGTPLAAELDLELYRAETPAGSFRSALGPDVRTLRPKLPSSAVGEPLDPSRRNRKAACTLVGGTERLLGLGIGLWLGLGLGLGLGLAW